MTCDHSRCLGVKSYGGELLGRQCRACLEFFRAPRWWEAPKARCRNCGHGFMAHFAEPDPHGQCLWADDLGARWCPCPGYDESDEEEATR